MLHGLLRYRLLIGAALAAWSLAVPSLGTAHAGSAQVTVVTAGGSERALSLDALAGGEDVLGQTYALRSATGESTATLTGFSLGAILDAAGADPIGFSYLEVQRPAGGSVLLSRHQALDLGAFPEGFPVVYATEAGTGFLRPSSAAEDLNASDSFEAPQGVTVVLRKGSPLQVRAKASTLRTRPGKPVSFSAIVERAGSGEELTYSWYFDDGQSGTGATAQHSFAKRGSYNVVVGVTTPGDETGASAVVTVQVGTPLGGPDRKGGGRNRAADAPDHGAASGTPGSTSSVPSTTPAAEAAAPPAPAKDAPRSKPQGNEAPPQAASGKQVSGLLLSGNETPELKPTMLPAARSGHLESAGSGGAGLPGAALGLLVTAGLLGLGVFAESRVAFFPLSGNKSTRGGPQ